MKHLGEWLETLRLRGVVLRQNGDKLNINAPQGVLTPADLETLRLKKTAVLEWLAERKEKRTPGQHAEKQGKTETRSRAQNRWHMSEYQLPFWYLENEQPASGMLNIPVGSRISGELQPHLLKLCMEMLRSRHEALRSDRRRWHARMG